MNRDASRNRVFEKIIQANGGQRNMNRILHGVLCFPFICTVFMKKQKSASYAKTTRLCVPISELIIGLETWRWNNLTQYFTFHNIIVTTWEYTCHHPVLKSYLHVFVSEDIPSHQFWSYRYSLLLLDFQHRVTDILKHYNTTLRKPALLQSSDKKCLTCWTP